MLIHIVITYLTLYLDLSLAQNANGAYPTRPPPQASSPYHNGNPRFDSHNDYRSYNPVNAIRTASNIPYPKPENMSNILVAQIHGQGVFGYASFHPINPTDGGVHFKLHIKSNMNSKTGDEKYTARIFEFPMKLSDGTTCSPPSLGKILYDLTAGSKFIDLDQERVLSIPDLSASGPQSIMGRTLVLQNIRDGTLVCSAIMPGDGSKMVLQGKFHIPVAGMAYYIQNDAGAVLGTEWMMFSDGRRRDDRFLWKLYKSSDVSPDDKVSNEMGRCAAPFRGDLIASSDQVLLPVSTETPVARGRMHVGLPSRVDRGDTVYLVVTTSKGVPVACTALNPIKPKVGVANFNSNDVSGTIKFVQDSPFEPTRVSINLRLASPAFSYGIDVLPSLRRRKQEPRKCPNVKETIYNPFHVDPDRVPAQGFGTSDLYAVGDLSGKYGTLENRQSITLETWDANLPLFGYYSVIGRAVVIYGPQGPAIACTNIELDGKILTTVYATFDYPIQGQFIFRQPEGECFSDTYLYIEVSRHPSVSTEKTSNHNWHVHAKPVELEGSALSTTSCAQAGPHHNPFNVSLPNHNPIYVRDCNLFTPTRCEVGDLASKLGTINIPPYKAAQGNKEPEVAKYYWIDSDLPLCGEAKIVDKSLVIHESDYQMPRLSCANLILYQPKLQN